MSCPRLTIAPSPRPVPHLATSAQRSNMRMAHVAMNLSRFPSTADSGKNRLINESTTFIG
ncbi:hypothetical protein B6I40_18700 [Klebsiella variicola]|nr:hypothetical protein B6I40_18700 [Klebsiella variicola]